MIKHKSKLSFEECMEITHKTIEEKNKTAKRPLAISNTYEFDEGVIVYMDDKEYLETGNISWCLIGIQPFIVDKNDGSSEYLWRTSGPHSKKERVLKFKIDKEYGSVFLNKLRFDFLQWRKRTYVRYWNWKFRWQQEFANLFRLIWKRIFPF